MLYGYKKHLIVEILETEYFKSNIENRKRTNIET